MYELEFTGSFDGTVLLVLGYDDTLLPPGFDEEMLALYHFRDDVWMRLDGTVDSLLNTISVTTDSLSPFGIGVLPEPATAWLMLAGAMAVLHRGRRRP